MVLLKLEGRYIIHKDGFDDQFGFVLLQALSARRRATVWDLRKNP